LSKNGIIIYLGFSYIEGQIFIMCLWSILVISFFLLMLIEILKIRIKIDMVKSSCNYKRLGCFCHDWMI
jgi:hypothetical protein